MGTLPRPANPTSHSTPPGPQPAQALPDREPPDPGTGRPHWAVRTAEAADALKDTRPTGSTVPAGDLRAAESAATPAGPPRDAIPPGPAPPATTADTPSLSAPSGASEAALQAALERHPDIRGLLRYRLLGQPERSARDTRGLLTLWQFYARLLEKTDPLSDDRDLIDRARDLVIVAELITRWPAHQTAFRRRHPTPTSTAFTTGNPPPEHGLDILAAAAEDDIIWSRAETAVLPRPLDGLRDLLRAHDGQEIAALYRRLI